jgi:hypothetical protein
VLSFRRNAHIPVELIVRFCAFDASSRSELGDAAESLSFSLRAFHSILEAAFLEERRDSGKKTGRPPRGGMILFPERSAAQN